MNAIDMGPNMFMTAFFFIVVGLWLLHLVLKQTSEQYAAADDAGEVAEVGGSDDG